jgi:hypothetical protein
MIYKHKGFKYGAWEIKIGEHSITIQATGNQTFPEIDRFYVPRIPDPKKWGDYYPELIPDAEKQIWIMLGVSTLSSKEKENLAQLIDRTKWKFSWTLARTYPHEYTTKKYCSLNDHAKLIDCIEHFGIIERFGKTYRKYFYFQERKYWHMGNPYSKDPTERPNVINRTWVDVRRHAENVQHVWTAEEVELQMRIWEIQLEKTTDR